MGSIFIGLEKTLLLLGKKISLEKKTATKITVINMVFEPKIQTEIKLSIAINW